MRRTLTNSLLFALMFVVCGMDDSRRHEMHYWKSAFMTAISGSLYFVVTCIVRLYYFRSMPGMPARQSIAGMLPVE